MPEEMGVWAYAVTASDLRSPGVAGLIGVGGEAVRVVEAEGLAAVVGTVPLAEFGEEPLQRKLGDIDSLERIARSHHDVIAATAGHGPTVPMRLATVYSDDAGVKAMLTEWREKLLLALKRITGRTEWGVKAYALIAGPTDAGSEEQADRPGTAYLFKRRAQLSSAQAARQSAVTSAQAVHEALSGIATASRLHAPQDPRLTGEAAEMVLNGAYLVDDEAAERFALTVRQLGQQHMDLRLDRSGPWPAYSFAVMEIEEPLS